MIPQSTANTILNIFAGASSYSAPETVYLGYCATKPNDTTGAVSGEPSNGYERLAIKNKFEDFFAAANGGILVNDKEIRMPTAQGDQGTMYYWFLSSSGGKGGSCYIYGELKHKNKATGQYEPGLTITDETVPVFYAGKLRASLDVALPELE